MTPHPWTNWTSNYESLIKKGTIELGVTSIGSDAFRYCSNLTSITLPDSVTSIGYEAFYDCTGLTSITIPDGVTSIGESAFQYCTGLKSITLPDSLTSIGDYAFYGCSGLTSITIPDSVTSIGEQAFTGCTGLTSITIPDSVTSIGDWAFNDCTGLTSITIPDSVTSIGDSAFYDCAGLTSVTLPDGVTSIGNCAFNGCTGLTSITIPDSVTSIGERAFFGCTSLKSITIPDSVTSIGEQAFNGCTGLTSITIPDSVTSIGDWAFNGCTGLTSITLPDSVTSIGYEAFYDCTGLTSIAIPDSVTSIGDYAFYGCAGLTSITIPDSVTSIGDWAFFGCTGLTSITIPDSVTSIGERAFFGCSGLTSITIPDSVTSIGGGAFSGCAGLTSITIPDSVTSIGECAFSGCTDLTSITLPDNMTSIGEQAFNGCTGLRSITLPDSVTSIGDCAFDGCTDLTSITLPDNMTSIGDYAFYNCTSLKAVAIPKKVKTIGKAAFSGCAVLETVTISEGVKSIGSSAFSGSERLKTIKIPKSVETIENDAFSGCDSLESVSFANGLKTIGVSAFAGENKIVSVTIPESVTSIGRNAFGGGKITSIKVESGNAAYSDKDGVLFNKAGTTLVSYPCGRYEESYDIPSGVKTIGIGAFEDCKELRSVRIPEGVTSIEESAFYRCWINTVYLPKSVKTIDRNAFESSALGLWGQVYYNGSESDWSDITIKAYNNPLLEAPIMYNYKAVTGVTLNKTALTLASNKSETLKVTVTPSDASIKTVWWDSSDWGVAEVDENGKVTAVGDGTAKITVTSDDGKKTASCVVTVHNLKKTEAKAATCTAVGNIEYYTCSTCGKLFSDAKGTKEIKKADTVVPALGHKWDSGKVTKAATCTETGVRTYTCQNDSSHTKTEVIAALGHKLTKTAAVAATCEKAGNKEYYTCSVCGKLFSDAKGTKEIKKADTFVPALGHKWDSGKVTKAATCTEPGVMTYTCVNDSKHTKTEAIAALGHKWDSGKVTKAATCTEPGVMTYTCVNDSKHTKTEAIAALGHKAGNAVIENEIAATCEEQGRYDEVVYCSVCGAELSRETKTVAAIGHLWDDGVVTKEATEREEGEMTFTCRNDASHIRKEVIPVLNPFRFDDVTDESKFYFTPVYWAVDHDPQITNGLDATHFGPDQTCTRGQVVTFLWRAKGCPEPASAKNPFTDVKTTDYFYKAVLWAVENGITNGTSGTTFSPKDPCTRAQVAAFLYRTEGSPAADAKNPFTDVQSGKYYYNAVLWAVAKNITAGTSATTFAPDAPCARGHIVTFLYRDLAG
ncbi:MAG: leucine-rich repeat protein [Bacillota bacterium]